MLRLWRFNVRPIIVPGFGLGALFLVDNCGRCGTLKLLLAMLVVEIGYASPQCGNARRADPKAFAVEQVMNVLRMQGVPEWKLDLLREAIPRIAELPAAERGAAMQRLLEEAHSTPEGT